MQYGLFDMVQWPASRIQAQAWRPASEPMQPADQFGMDAAALAAARQR